MTKRLTSQQLRQAFSRKRIIKAIGIAGVLAFIGSGLQVLSLMQDRAALVSGDVAQETMIAILDTQLGVQEDIATFQASDVNAPQPTATAIAATVSALVSTQIVLEAQRENTQATLTALPQAQIGPNSGPPEITPVAPSSPSAQPIVNSQIEGVRVQLLEFSRFQNTITAKLRFLNSRAEQQRVTVTFLSSLFDNVTHREYPSVAESHGLSVNIPANGYLDVWAKYALPDDENPPYLDLVLPNGVLFERLQAEEIPS